MLWCITLNILTAEQILALRIDVLSVVRRMSVIRRVIRRVEAVAVII